VLLGAILAVLEGWHFANGFHYVLSILAHTGSALTAVTPMTTAGMPFAALIALCK
jgi:hypothetical protein